MRTISLLATILFAITESAHAQTGACCDDIAHECVDNVDESDCPPPLRFAPDTLCQDMVPP